MKIAIVHDYIKEYGGAERVLEALHELYPNAPVYTLVYCQQFLGPHKTRFSDWNIKTSWFQYVPFKEKLISPLRLLAPFLFQQFDFSGFDVVIVSATGAYTPNTIRCHLHISYCHTPPRYLYGYATAREWKKNSFVRVFGEIANHFLRLIDFKSAQNVDYFIANSKEVASRIKKFYRKNSVIIYPPVDMGSPGAGPATRSSHGAPASLVRLRRTANAGALRGSPTLVSPANIVSQSQHPYYLAGGRLARPKHIDLIVKTCQNNKIPLKVFGKGFAGYDTKLKMNGNDSFIEFAGEVSDGKKWELMRGAKAYIFAAEDEDFGITPVEAMAAGIPVVAYRSGGVQESVVEEKTGVFFDELTSKSLLSAIKKLEKLSINPEDCIKQAQKFSKATFQQSIQKYIEGLIKSR